MEKKLSVIVPAYNEEESVAGTLAEIADYLKANSFEFEVLVINDGSRDLTSSKVKECSSIYPEIRLINREKNLGKGQTVKQGIAEAKYSHCLFIDADNSTSIREWPAFEAFFDKGYKAVIASRHLPGSKIVTPQPIARRVFGTGYRILSRLIFGVKASDFNCGFKAYETPIAKKIYTETVMSDWTFDVEVLCRLKKSGVRVAEVPVTWRHYGKGSHAALSNTIFKTFSSLIKLKQLLA